MSWTWRYTDPTGADMDVADSQSFESRSDAESWLGEHFAELADQGVEAVTLYEAERKVYGPMSLSAP